MMPQQAASPPHSPKSTPKTKRTSTSAPMSIDLSTIPPLVPPSPPSNTLIITNLKNSSIFSAAHLQHLYSLFSSPTPLNSFSPLPSLQRLIISYPTTDAAIATRQLLENDPSATFALFSPAPPSVSDGQKNSNDKNTPPPKVYFGASTPLVGSTSAEDTHLKAPSLGKLLFISPPPSPPCGWEIREEEPPNKETHAEDLQRALAGLVNLSQSSSERMEIEGGEANDNGTELAFGQKKKRRTPSTGSRSSTGSAGNGRRRNMKARGRTNTVTVYDPLDHGDSEDLPQVMVEDTGADNVDVSTGGDADADADDDGDDTAMKEAGGSDDEAGVGMELEGKKIMTHTARPPVELMES